jgi:hypothetical protein
LSTLALSTSDADAQSRGRAPLALRYADIGLLIIALPLFIFADLPMAGYVACAGAWLVQHALYLYAERSAAASLRGGDRRRALGTIGFATLGRVWVVTGTILAVGLIGEREDGLAAAVLALALVTVHFATLATSRLLYPQEGAN